MFNDTTILLGNFLSLISIIFTISIGLIKDKKKILFGGIFEKISCGIANVILGGYSGAISNGIGILRNILCYKNKLNFKSRTILGIFQTILFLTFNNEGLLGLLPLIATISATFFMVYDAKKLKVLFITTSILWLIYNIAMNNYIASLSNAFTIISNIIGLYKIHKTATKQLKIL